MWLCFTGIAKQNFSQKMVWLSIEVKKNKVQKMAARESWKQSELPWKFVWLEKPVLLLSRNAAVIYYVCLEEKN